MIRKNLLETLIIRDPRRFYLVNIIYRISKYLLLRKRYKPFKYRINSINRIRLLVLGLMGLF